MNSRVIGLLLSPTKKLVENEPSALEIVLSVVADSDIFVPSITEV